MRESGERGVLGGDRTMETCDMGERLEMYDGMGEKKEKRT